MKEQALEKKIEALLFAYGDPITVKKLTGILSTPQPEVENALMVLKNRLAEKSGLRILKQDEEVQLVTAPEYADTIEELFKNQQREELTRASLEVLSIVAYNNSPVTREEIEAIRGVNSAYILRRLTMRGMIEKQTHEDTPTTYTLSLATLRQLGVEKKEDLPEWEDIRSEIEQAEEALSQE